MSTFSILSQKLKAKNCSRLPRSPENRSQMGLTDLKITVFVVNTLKRAVKVLKICSMTNQNTEINNSNQFNFN